QSLSVFGLARERVAATGATVDRNQLTLAWMRDSVASLLAVDKKPFKGNASGWSGTSANAVLQPAGIPVPVRWQLGQNGAPAIAYSEWAGHALVLPAPAGELRFAYLDAKGEQHSHWPPRLGEFPDLPAAIALEVQGHAAPLFVVAIVGQKKPLTDQGSFDTEGDQ
ncbi:type II secretion system protein, partial [mine drainage metagenome]